MRWWVLLLAGVSAGSAAESFTADFYRADASRFLGKEIRLRVASVDPHDKLTELDPDFVWMQATTGRPKKEEGKIFLRVPRSEAEKLAKMVNQPSTSGRLIEGKFFDRSLGLVLRGAICQEAPDYLQTGRSAEMVKDAGGEGPVSGSLVIAPKAKTAPVPAAPQLVAKPLPPLTPPPVSLTKPSRKQWVVCRSKSGGNLELKLGQSVELKNGVYEVTGSDGKLSVLGEASVVGVVPFPEKADLVTAEEVQAALQRYAELENRDPSATALLAESKGAWQKMAAPAVATAAGKELTQLDEVDRAAGVEEPAFTVWPWLLGGLGGMALFVWLGWAWLRRNSVSS